jgi:hypothetical protein
MSGLRQNVILCAASVDATLASAWPHAFPRGALRGGAAVPLLDRHAEPRLPVKCRTRHRHVVTAALSCHITKMTGTK